MSFLSILLLILSVNDNINAINMTLSNESNFENVHRCLTYQLINISHTNLLIISEMNYYLDLLKHVKSTVTMFNIKFENIYLKLKYDMIVIITQKFENFKFMLRTLKKNINWNPRARFLIGYVGSENITIFFELSWSYFVLNINLISNNGSIYTYFPYNNGLCGNIIKSEYLLTCDVNNLAPYFSKIPSNLYGCEFRIMPYPMIPYIMNISAPKTEPNLAGLEVTIMDTLAKKINFSVVYIPCFHNLWGYKDSSGVYTMMFGSLYNNETDIIMGMTYANASHVVDFDGSYIYLQDFPEWWVPTAMPAAQWKNLTAIFDARVWLVMFVAFFINSLMWWIFGRKNESTNFNDLTLCFMNSLYTLLQGSIKHPRTLKLRIIFICWLVTCLLIFAAHQSSLVSILTTPIFDHQISTVEELLQSSLPFGFYLSAALAFEEKNNWIAEQILKKHEICPLSLYCLNRTAYDRNFAFLRNGRNAKYFIPRLYTFPNGRSMITGLDIRGPGIWVRLHTAKGLPILEKLNHYLMLLQSNGLIAKWDLDTNFKALKLENDDSHQPLNVYHLQAAFLIFVFGATLSAFIFLLEICSVRITTSNKKDFIIDKNGSFKLRVK